MSTPNQKKIKTKKTKPSSDFLLISNQDWIEASKTLSAPGFQMYLWLIRHDPSFTNELSKQAFMNSFGVSESTYKRAWSDLKDKGYVRPSKEGSNIYYIYSNPNNIKTDPNTNSIKTDLDNVKVKNDTNNKKSNSVKNEPITSSKLTPNRVRNDLETGSKMNTEIDNINSINIINSRSDERSSPPQQEVKNDTNNLKVKTEPITITQEDFLNQGLAQTMTGFELDNDGNKIAESCGKLYRILTPSSQKEKTLSVQEKIAALGF